MSSSLGLSPELIRYLADTNPAEHPALVRCREETQSLPERRMQISAEQGAFMAALLRLIGARRMFEVGVFTGYSALVAALTLQDMHPAGARILALDISEQWTTLARNYWREANVEALIEVVIAPAVESMDARLAAGEGGGYDFGFIDADKAAYDAYYERGLSLLRPGGVLLFDNMLWGGAVADPADTSRDTTALRALAHKAKADPRVHAVMLGVGDGLLLTIKR
ncbi:MAG: class I SAM-dependent methyltransferase [Hyphomonadaceae bacterium]|nr:class I SAM-dependent methyltransferase [Hyphomonadaceae bacterium]MBX3510292.1 class I SAM-dependent methyltransferase [Hyphomonadaceae bacterium]